MPEKRTVRSDMVSGYTCCNFVSESSAQGAHVVRRKEGERGGGRKGVCLALNHLWVMGKQSLLVRKKASKSGGEGGKKKARKKRRQELCGEDFFQFVLVILVSYA